ncbi:carboxypeptidase M32 [Rubrivirga marina]|uniref:Metal-dependent carboxypeptidase n=1 Tax=Rubrivirga marina TaxID=1196024 RepID=A0A271IYW2_9BACT|nr:carboxypeptidase M32 [Rubrivirga marina]PAP76320.1 carboxypeptidase [Rubrivirga marina]
MPVPDALLQRLAEVADLAHAAAVLEWDQETYMPPGGAEARGRQVATLRRFAHERFVDERVGEWIEAGTAESDLDAALLRVTARDWRRATLLPSRLVSEKAEASARAKGAWKAAREADSFELFAPHLERILALAREEADLVRPLVAEERGPGYAPSGADARYDALLDAFEPGASASGVAAVFAELREGLVPLVAAVAGTEPPDDACLRQPFDADAQWAFGLDVAQQLGYSLDHGRQDRSAHPFTTAFGATDVRITTRVDPDFFPTAFFSTIHEAGHGIYEQGFAPELAGTPLADGASLGVHESQSRLYENLVARSAPFWTWAYPMLEARFPHLQDVPRDAFVRAVNRVEPSLIRVEADELTYHLHVLLRFELERAMLSGDLAVSDLPGAWNERMTESFGIAPPTDADGCLQDIHWSLGAVGYFPTYTLGTLMSAQLWTAADADLGGLDAQMERGEFDPLLGWLREHVHRWGRAKTAGQILRDATGSDLDAGPWLTYAREKVQRLYGVGA